MKVAQWEWLATWVSKLSQVHAIHLSLTMRNSYYSVLQMEAKTKIVTGERKFLYNDKVPRFLFFRFDGTSFSPSQPSTFMHERVTSIGNYRGQPFTSGGMAQTDTEILTISTDTWRSGTRYPWSGTDSTGWNIHVNQIFHFINKPFSDLHIIQRRQLVKDFTFSVVI